MKLGLLGGTFDPIHLGHLILAENCLEACQLDALWFLPTGIPPHKDVSQLTPGHDRVEMLQLATAGHPHFSVHTLEMDPYTLAPLGVEPFSLAAMQARALLEHDLATEAEKEGRVDTKVRVFTLPNVQPKSVIE